MVENLRKYDITDLFIQQEFNCPGNFFYTSYKRQMPLVLMLLLCTMFFWYIFCCLFGTSKSPPSRLNYTIVVRCAIWQHLYNFKNVKNTHGGVLILVQLYRILVQDFNTFQYRICSLVFSIPYSSAFECAIVKMNRLILINLVKRFIQSKFCKLLK